MIQILNPEIAKYRGTLAYTTAAGQPAKVDGKPMLAVAGLGTCEQVTDDGLTLELTPPESGMVSDGDKVTITITADADLGDGVKPLELVAEIIWQREAANATLKFEPVVG